MFPIMFVSIFLIYLLMHAYICLSIICISYYLFLCLLLFIYLSNLTIYLFTCFFLSHFFCTVTHVPLCISLSLQVTILSYLSLSLSLFRSHTLSLSSSVTNIHTIIHSVFPLLLSSSQSMAFRLLQSTKLLSGEWI